MSSSCIIWSAIVTNERGAASAICDARVSSVSAQRRALLWAHIGTWMDAKSASRVA